MKTTFATALLVAAVAAQPHGHKAHDQLHQKRAMVVETEWVTEVETVTEYMDASTTYIMGQAAETTLPGQLFQPETSTTSTSTTSSSSSSVYVAPPEPTKTTTIQLSSVAQPTSTTSTTSTTQEAAPTGGNGGSGGSGGNGETYKGDLTYYTVGLGACGIDQTGMDDSEDIVALSYEMMGTASNDNSFCGKTVTITANGKTATGKVTDKCMGCSKESIDVSEKLFLSLFDSLDVGRGPVKWSIN